MPLTTDASNVRTILPGAMTYTAADDRYDTPLLTHQRRTPCSTAGSSPT